MSKAFSEAATVFIKYCKDVMFDTSKTPKWLKETKLHYRDYNGCFEICLKEKIVGSKQMPLYANVAVKLKDTFNNFDPDDTDWIDDEINIAYIDDNDKPAEGLTLHVSRIYKLCDTKAQRLRFLGLFFATLSKSLSKVIGEDELAARIDKLSGKYLIRADKADKEPKKPKKAEDSEEEDGNPDIMSMVSKMVGDKKNQKKFAKTISGVANMVDVEALTKGNEDFQEAVEKGDKKKVNKIIEDGVENITKKFSNLGNGDDESDESSEESEESEEKPKKKSK